MSHFRAIHSAQTFGLSRQRSAVPNAAPLLQVGAHTLQADEAFRDILVAPRFPLLRIQDPP
jgi:hypothetical protein